MTPLSFSKLLNSLRWFPFQEEPQINLPLTPKTSQTKHLIYIFRNKMEEIYLIGKTDQFLANRFSGYLKDIRHPGSEGGQREFPLDVRQAPADFEAAILYEASPGQDLGYIETLLITLFRIAGLQLYNQNQGGGGGSTREPDEVPFDEENLTPEEKVYETPVKYFPVQVKDQKIQIPLSPSTRKLENVVYVFKNVETDQRLVGTTGQKVHKRLSHYIYAFNHQNTVIGKRLLPTAVRARPHHFVFGILKKVEDRKRIFYEEQRYIYLLKQISPLFNQNRGGGGPSVTKSLNLPPDFKKKLHQRISKHSKNIQVQDRGHLAEIVKLLLFYRSEDKERATPKNNKRERESFGTPSLPTKKSRLPPKGVLSQRTLFPQNGPVSPVSIMDTL